MKKLFISALCFLAVILLCTGCKKEKAPNTDSAPTDAAVDLASDPREDAAPQPETDSTTQVTESEISTVETALKEPFRTVLELYSEERNSRRGELGYPPMTSLEIYYCQEDINGDNVPELIISEDGIDPSALYTLRENEAVELFFPERHGRNYILADGSVQWQYKGCVIYRLVGDELVPYFNIDDYHSIGSELWKSHCAELLTENGIPTDLMFFDFAKWQ